MFLLQVSVSALVFLSMTHYCVVVRALNLTASRSECTYRFEYRHELMEKFQDVSNLDDVLNVNCAKNYTVAYNDFPPYVFLDKHDGKVKGILPGMLDLALETCCFGKNRIVYDGPYKHIERYYVKNASFVMPVQTTLSGDKYFGYSYIHMLSVSSAGFFAAPVRPDPISMGKTLTKSILNTWPMLIIVFIMSVAAGVCVWVLDANWNENEFPRRFPEGPLEGCWWAFISMTTVGYGDKCPQSPFARMFAVIWILMGITVFSMYTASLTGALTSAISLSQEISLENKKFGILNTTSVGMIASNQMNVKPVSFETLPELAEAYKKGEIEGIVLDANMANFFMEELKTFGLHDLTLHRRAQVSGISFGIVATAPEDRIMFDSFFKNNDDNRVLMGKLAIDGHKYSQSLSKATEEVNDFFAANSPMYIMTMTSAVVISIVVTIIGLLLTCFCKRVNSAKNNELSGFELMSSKESDLLELMQTIDGIKEKVENMLQSERTKETDVKENGDHTMA